MDVALGRLHVMHIVLQHHDAARGIHDVVVQLLRQVLPQVQRMVIEARAFVIEIVGADDGGVAAGIAAAEPALFDHGDVLDAVFLGEIIGRAEAMPARSHDHHVIGRPRLRGRPLPVPALMAAHGLPGDREDGIFAHACSPACGASSALDLTKPCQIEKVDNGPFATLNDA
jgi:hypothetical protein